MSDGTGTGEREAADEARAGAHVRELIEFAVAQLPGMQLGDGSFRQPTSPGAKTGQDRHSTRQTAIVLLGLLRAEEHGIEHPFHTGGLRGRLLGDAGQGRESAGDLALILWAESRLEGDAIDELVGHIGGALGVDGSGAISGSELSWLLTALVEIGARDKRDREGDAIAEEARAELLARRRPDTGMFEGPGHGPGRRFQSFESQIQIVASLAQLNKLEVDSEAGEAARAAADGLLGIQREDGSWPAVIDVRRGAAVEAYPLTSVNQAALAPIGFAAVSSITGDDRYRRAGIAGLSWIWGGNELGYEMLERDSGTLCRAIVRKERLDRAHLLARAAASYLKPVAEHEAPHTLGVDRTTSPADLGWVLEAWAGRASELETPAEPHR